MHVFFHNKKDKTIERGGYRNTDEDEFDEVLTALNKVLKQFPDMWVTSNLVELEYSVLKRFMPLQGRSDVELWYDYILGYFSIRDDPKLLQQILKDVRISCQAVVSALPAIMSITISSC